MVGFWALAPAIGLGALAIGLVVSSFRWRRRLVWVRRVVGGALLISSVVVGLVAGSARATPSFVNRPAPLVASAVVFAATSDTTVTAYQAATGKTVWSYTQPGVVIVDLQQYQQTLVVVSDLTTSVYTASPQGTALTGLDATSGQVRWHSSRRDYAQFAPMTAQGVSVNQGVLYLAGESMVNGVPTSHALLLAVDMTTGAIRWSTPESAPIDSSDDWMPKLASDANALYVDVAYGIQALRASDGAPRWAWSTDGAPLAGIFAAGGLVFAASRSQQVIALTATTGAVAWRRTLGSLDFAPTRVLVQNGIVYISGADNGSLTVYALLGATGAQVWRRDVGMSGTADNIGNIYGGMGQYLTSNQSVIVVNASDGIRALDSATGADRWRLAATSTLFFEGESGGGEWTHPAHLRIAPMAIGAVLYLQAIQAIPSQGWFGTGNAHDQPYLYAVSAFTGQPYWREQRAPDFVVYPHVVY